MIRWSTERSSLLGGSRDDFTMASMTPPIAPIPLGTGFLLRKPHEVFFEASTWLKSQNLGGRIGGPTPEPCG